MDGTRVLNKSPWTPGGGPSQSPTQDPAFDGVALQMLCWADFWCKSNWARSPGRMTGSAGRALTRLRWTYFSVSMGRRGFRGMRETLSAPLAIGSSGLFRTPSKPRVFTRFGDLLPPNSVPGFGPVFVGLLGALGVPSWSPFWGPFEAPFGSLWESGPIGTSNCLRDSTKQAFLDQKALPN